MERDERMARFLNTEEISSELSRIIDSGDGRLLLISPFLRLNRRLREALELQDRKSATFASCIASPTFIRRNRNGWRAPG